MTDRFTPGEEAWWIVGMPGPDIDNCTVVQANPDGTYLVKYQVWGSGPWHEGIAYPGRRGISGLFKRRAS